MDKISVGKEILRHIHSKGYEAYFVGGFVRDQLLKIHSNDIDITTNATPEEIEKIFDKTVATGKKYGTVTVFVDNYSFEITTYRIDQDYQDHRKPERVKFSHDLAEDLMRRDFTINAMAMDIEGDIIDFHDGKTDLTKRIIRAIGDPETRFKEDALRILRAIRFVAKLNFTIEEKTQKAIEKNLKLLLEISIERIINEFEQIFAYDHHKEALKYLVKSDIVKVFNEFNPGLELYIQSSIKLNFLEFFALCLYVNKLEIPNYWRFSNKEKTRITRLINIVKVTQRNSYNPLLVYQTSKELCLSANEISQVINFKNNQKDLIEQIDKHLPIRKTQDLKINGNDLLKIADFANEEIIGEILKELEAKVLHNELENEDEELIAYAKRMLERLDG
jgi:tRNA nucleotidyltransferase (CCA-adding enzyme)